MVEITVDSRLTFAWSAISGTERGRLKNALRVRNYDKEMALREHVFGAGAWPDHISLWEEDGPLFIAPRGYADLLPDLIEEEIWWEDKRRTVPIDTSSWSRPEPYPDQEQAVTALLLGEQGVYQAPAGSGKTVTMLEVIRNLQQRALVIVNSSHIAEQWRDRAREHLGLEDVGLVGDGSWTEADLTIALQQTLWSRRDDLAGWWGQWGLVCLDECHHVPANTFYDIIQRFPARYRFGTSATPDKHDYDELVRMALGPTLHAAARGTLVRAGRIVNPTVKIVQSGFTYGLWPTHRARKDPDTEQMVCEYKGRGCDRKGIIHRNNYHELIAALIVDDDRNDLIADEVASAYRDGRAVLVLSRRLAHLDDMARRVIARIGSPGDVYRLSGKEKTEERMAIYERAAAGKLVIFSTIADEAMDIPRLDTIVLAFPTKNTGLVEQQIGRVSRILEGKPTPLVIDVEDDVGTLRRQLGQRLRLYKKHGLTIV